MQTRSESDLAAMLMRLLKLGFGFAGGVAAALGLWMVVSPQGWFDIFPGEIRDFGPANVHFIRDLGGWYLASGVLFLFALTNPLRFGGVALIVNLIATGVHAGSHIDELVSGRVAARHWIIDAPTVFAAVILNLVLLWLWWRLQSEEHALLEHEEPVEEYN